MKHRPYVYVPHPHDWDWRYVSQVYVQLHLDKSKRSYRELDQDLALMDEETGKIQQEIRGVWASANVQIMRAFESRLKEVRRERKRIAYIQKIIREAIDEIHARGKTREWNLK